MSDSPMSDSARSDEEEQPNFRVLKAVVILLGIAIVVMTGIIIYTAIDRLGETETASEAETAPSAGAEPAASAAPWVFNANPSGVQGLQGASLDGNRVLIEVRGPGDSRSVQIIDVRNGRLIGTITDR